MWNEVASTENVLVNDTAQNEVPLTILNFTQARSRTSFSDDPWYF